MRLKRLDLVGFKSFATKSRLEFADGLTAIVGPNGSGKSNISDAVRWVLGEQSAKTLRGTKMEDIIFAGTDSQKPLGMAEVQLTLDNSDGFLPIEYNEVTITRRVFRSGESEFLINNNRCRLKDIQDLITDTGLGKDGLAIIGQGQVDAVLSVNSSDRRALLEETAGIMKYRNKKEEAVRKIERTKQDIVRITDIFNELRSRLGPLEKEAEQAKIYKALSTDLNNYQVDYDSLIYGKLVEDRNKLQEQISGLKNEYSQLEKELENLEEKTQTIQLELNDLDEKANSAQSEFLLINDQVSTLSERVQVVEERIKNTKAKISELEDSLKASQERESELDHQIQECKNELTNVLLEHEEMNVALEKASSEVAVSREEYQTKTQLIEDMKVGFLDFMRKLAEERNFVRNFSQQEESLKQRLAKASDEKDTLIQRKAELEKNLKELQAEKQGRVSEISKLNSKLTTLQQKKEQCESSLSQALEKLAHKMNQRQQNDSQLKALKSLEDDYEGYSLGVKRLMQLPKKDFNLTGTVAELIEVPKGFETAFEIALGASLQNIIAPTQQDAKLAIEWLKKANAGRATFLPLDEIKYSEFPKGFAKYWEISGVHGPAVNLLKYDPKIHSAIASLLGRVVITEDLDTALALRSVLPSFSRIVTKAGELIMPSGAMTGGSLGTKTVGLLQRKSRISEIEILVQTLNQEIEVLKQEQVGLNRSISEFNSQINELMNANRELENEIRQLDTQLTRYETELVQLDFQIESKSGDCEELKLSLNSLHEEEKLASKRLKELEHEEVELRLTIKNLEEELRVYSQDIEKSSENVTQQRIKLTEIAGIVNQKRRQLKDLEELYQRQINESVRQQNEIALLKNLLAELEEQMQADKNDYDNKRQQKTVLAEKIEKIRTERLTKQNLLLEENQQVKAYQKRFRQVEVRINELDLKINKIEYEMGQVSERLADRQVSEEQALAREVKESRTHLKKEIDRLKIELMELGDVNLKAIEEFQEVSERCEFLESQLNDLYEAKGSLEKVIREMDEVSKQRFAETFEQVRNEFKNLFQELFQGGHADLVLADPTDLLNTGVDIIAQPPGKKLQNVLMLSGGERALTAIALLFSIRKAKPTPFCILDEIDAALDEGNLERFSRLLKSFSQETQCLVISHRQSTIENADNLYGITMSKQAISQLVSVRLSQIS
ncbi:MAG: chromosome segregation protein SMC [Firmicutes bacterium]|nr:chromosome segregation protein SMC [Bacillota bacterium]